MLTALGGGGPLVRASDVSMIGPRDNPAWYAGDDVARARDAMQMLLLADLRRMGMAAAGDAVAARLDRPRLAGAWIHCDVDVLNDDVMPAVDSRQPDGLSYDELDALLRPILDSGVVVGMHLTIYDPDRDPDLVAGRALVAGVGRLFRR